MRLHLNMSRPWDKTQWNPVWEQINKKLCDLANLLVQTVESNTRLIPVLQINE